MNPSFKDFLVLISVWVVSHQLMEVLLFQQLQDSSLCLFSNSFHNALHAKQPRFQIPFLLICRGAGRGGCGEEEEEEEGKQTEKRREEPRRRELLVL